MKLNRRERILIVTAVACMVIVGLYGLMLNSKRSNELLPEDGEVSLASLQSQLLEQVALNDRLESLKERNNITIPSVEPKEQVAVFVKALQDSANSSGIKYTSFSPREKRTKSAPRKAGDSMQFDVRFTASHSSLVKYFTALRTAGLPHKVDSISISSDASKPDQLELNASFSFYFLEPMNHEIES